MDADLETYLADYLASPGAQKIVVTLDKHGSLILRELAFHAELSEPFVRKEMDKLEGWGLVTVAHLNKRTYQFSLTPRGKKFAGLTYKQVELIREGAEEKAKEGPRT